MNEQWDEFDAEPPVSPDLTRDLTSLFDAAELRVPPAIDQRILNHARARIIGRRRPLLLRWAAAAAAVVAVVVWVGTVSTPPNAHVASALPADIDGNGQVNILDALVLARQVDSHRSDARDVNRDGAADRRDVDAVAMLAVNLQRGGAR